MRRGLLGSSALKSSAARTGSIVVRPAPQERGHAAPAGAESVQAPKGWASTKWLWLGLWLSVMVFGSWGMYQRLTSGHQLANYGNFVTWGLWVSAYIWFIGLSAGSFLLSALVYVFGMRQLESIAKLALFTALIALFAALVSITSDIGHMERIWEFYVRGNWRSMMAWMVWLYSAYFILVTAELWFAMRRDLAARAGQGGAMGGVARLLTLGLISTTPESHERDRRVLRVLASIGVPLAVAFHGGVGALFAVVMARPYWNTPIFPIAFLVGALLSGTAFFSVVMAFFWPRRQGVEYQRIITLLGRFTLGLLAFYLLMEWAELSIGLYYSAMLNRGTPDESRAVWEIIAGPYPWVFWLLHLGIGSVVPVALLAARPKAPWAVGAAGLLVAASFLAVRVNIVVPALALPQLPGLETAYVDARLTLAYFPSVFEWAVLAFIGAVAAALFYLGYRLLPLTPGREATERVTSRAVADERGEVRASPVREAPVLGSSQEA